MGDVEGFSPTTQAGAGHHGDARTSSFVPVPGLVYLRRPHGTQSPAGQSGEQPAPSRVSPPTSTPAPESTPAADRAAPPAGAGANRRVAQRVGMLISVWLEVLDGRRPVSALRKGPYSPVISESLRGMVRESAADPGGRGFPTEVSRVLAVHIPPSHRERLGFTASVARDGRVRAVAGHLARYDGQWRIESIVII